MSQLRILILFALAYTLASVSACTSFERAAASASDTGGSSDNTVDTGSDNTVDTSSDNTVDTDPETGTTVDPEFLQIKIVYPAGTQAVIHKENQPWESDNTVENDSECRISVDDDRSDIRCVVEGIELGLYASQGFALNYNIPEGLCKYTEVWPYYFYYKTAGYGPSSYKSTVTDGGNPVLSDIVDVTAGITAEVRDGIITCTANHSDGVDAEDCCEGRWEATERVIDTDLGTDVTTVNYGDWGGLLSTCLRGPAMDSQPLTLDHYPMGTVIPMEGIALNRDYEIMAPINKAYGTNLYIANYFDISNSFASDDLDAEFDWTTAPIALQGPTPWGRVMPWYEFSCLDEGEDIIHRVRVQIRSWSSEEQYAIGAEGSYDLGGAEIYFTQHNLLDRFGWFISDDWDLMTEYPGNGL